MERDFGIVIIFMTRRFTVRVYVKAGRCQPKLNVINKVLLFGGFFLKLRLSVEFIVDMVHDERVLFLWAEQNELRILVCPDRMSRRPVEQVS